MSASILSVSNRKECMSMFPEPANNSRYLKSIYLNCVNDCNGSLDRFLDLQLCQTQLRICSSEAEHHQHALDDLKRVAFRSDLHAKRVGMYTTQPIKHASCQLLNYMLREGRIQMSDTLVSRDAAAAKTKFREQLEIFSYQWKTAEMVFQQDRCVLSGKVGGMKDDIVMAFMLGIYFTQLDSHQGNIPPRQ